MCFRGLGGGDGINRAMKLGLSGHTCSGKIHQVLFRAEAFLLGKPSLPCKEKLYNNNKKLK